MGYLEKRSVCEREREKEMCCRRFCFTISCVWTAQRNYVYTFFWIQIQIGNPPPCKPPAGLLEEIGYIGFSMVVFKREFGGFVQGIPNIPVLGWYIYIYPEKSRNIPCFGIVFTENNKISTDNIDASYLISPAQSRPVSSPAHAGLGYTPKPLAWRSVTSCRRFWGLLVGSWRCQGMMCLSMSSIPNIPGVIGRKQI